MEKTLPGGVTDYANNTRSVTRALGPARPSRNQFARVIRDGQRELAREVCEAQRALGVTDYANNTRSVTRAEEPRAPSARF